ncbi:MULTISPECIES: hypothetical protein [Anaeromyxobacter]|uniref:hypothetical protein n=2 Tax=Anaeromyxobacteraceae TaxID=1524215 RepID=UPI001F5A3C67|nr:MULTISPECIES: hypothetical protein [unclassified Anaeromyxobacter]
MTDRLAELEARHAETEERLRRLEQRLAALEGAPGRARAAGRAGTPRSPAAAPPGQELAAALGSVSLVGRTLLVLAGAFVLRALADAGTLPAAVGVALGLAYAATWLGFALRAGAKAGATASAAFHGTAAALVGFPLVYEAASRFGLASPPAAAALLTLFTAAALAVAARRRLEALAWIVTLGGIATAVALAAATGRLGPPALFLVLLGVATLWLSYVLDWFSLRALPAVAADLAAAVLAVRVGLARGGEGALAAFAVLTPLMALYLGTVATRTLLLRRDVLAFEIAQSAAAIAVGLGGAAFVATRSGAGASAIGAAVTVLGLAAYAVAFAFLERPLDRRRNFVFYTSAAALLVLAGTGLLLDGPALPVAWIALAVAAGALGRRQGRLTLAAHAAGYAAAAAIASGLVAHAAETSLASPRVPWTPVTPPALAVLAGLLAVAWIGAEGGRHTRAQRVPRIVLLATLAAGLAGVAIGWIAPAVAGLPGPGADAGELAAVRTTLLVCVTLGLASLGRLPAWSDGAALAYPALAAIGLKIVLEDLPRGRPATLLVAFACYGAALILVPRIRRRRAEAPAARSAA